MIRALVIASLLVACNDPPLTLQFRVTPGDEAACFVGGKKVTACEDVTMSCDMIVSLRVFPPNDPTSPVISVCRPPIGERDLCSLGSIDLPPPNYEIDEQTLEVQILVYQAKQIPKNAKDEWQCPSDVMFDAQGFPIASVTPCVGDGVCDPLPAIGGVAFYHPGDALTLVDLGCVDYDLLNDTTCTGATSTAVSASVIDFDTQVPVSSMAADQLTVSVGQPKSVPDTIIHYRLLPSDGETMLARNQTPTPAWSGSVMSPLQPACIEVHEEVGQSTSAVRCVANSDMADALDMTGTQLSRETLDDVLAAIGSPGAFPPEGLVIGVVLDRLGIPRAGAQVATNCTTDMPCSVQYLNATRDGVVTTGTTSNGIFISKDAPFNTMFSTTTTNPVAPQLGGKIDGKVTVVILQEKSTTGI